MKRWTLFLAVLCLGIGSGCAAHQKGVMLLVDPSCLTAPIELTGCDLLDTHCKHAKIQYRKGCERIRLTNQ
jgi:hypothetical protein